MVQNLFGDADFFKRDTTIFESFPSHLSHLKNPCHLCGLYKQGCKRPAGVWQQEDVTEVDIMIIGESPGQQEDEVYGIPFVGHSGQLARRILKELNFNMGRVYITNAVKCRPPQDDLKEKVSIGYCRTAYLEDEILIMQPKIILCFGTVALSSVMGKDYPITKHRGVFLSTIIKEKKFKVIGTYHPAFVSRSPGFLEVFKDDCLISKKEAEKISVNIVEKPNKVPMTLIFSDQEVSELENEFQKTTSVVLDLETYPLDPYDKEARILTCSVTFDNEKTCVVPFQHTQNTIPYSLQAKIVTIFQKYLSDNKITIINHNAPFDLLWLELHLLGGVRLTNYRDTMLEHFLAIDEMIGSQGLKVLATKYTEFGGYENSLDEFFEKNSIKGDDSSRDYSKVPLRMLMEYNGMDTHVTKIIEKITWKALQNESMVDLYKTIVLPAVRFVVDMKRTGFKVDFSLLEKLDKEYTETLELLEKKLQSTPDIISACEVWMKKKREKNFEKTGKWKDFPITEFNVASVDAMRILLFHVLGCPILKKTEKEQPSTDAEVLDQLQRIYNYPVINTIQEIRKVSKLQSMYSKEKVMSWHKSQDMLVHTNFYLTKTVTGRLSSGDPVNFQNFPRTGSVKKLIVSRFQETVNGMVIKGKICKGDFSQIELRILAQYSQDFNMLKAFHDELDIHIEATLGILDMTLEQYNALDKVEAKNLRQIGKTYNFALVYGQGDDSTAQQLSSVLKRPVDVSEAAQKKQKYMERFAGVSAWIKKTEIEAEKQGFVTTMFGRKRRLPALKMKEAYDKFREALRQAVNSRVQGTASDLLLLAGIKMNNKLREKCMKSLVIGSVHDELVVDVHPAETQVIPVMLKSVMLDSPSFITVPLEVEVKIGDNWMDAENV